MRNFLPVLWDVSIITCVLSGLSYAINLFAPYFKDSRRSPICIFNRAFKQIRKLWRASRRRVMMAKKAQIMESTSKKFPFTIHWRIWFWRDELLHKLSCKIQTRWSYQSSRSLPNRRENAIKGPQICAEIKSRATTLIMFIKYPHQSRFKNMRFMGSLIGKVQYLIGCQWTVSWYNS
jgi:hypothetical protein